MEPSNSSQKATGIIPKFRHFVDLVTLKSVYYSTIYSHAMYDIFMGC